MSEHVYEEPDIIRNVQRDQNNKENIVDISAESLKVYENASVENVSPNIPGPAEAQTPGRRDLVRPAAAFLGLLCLLLLAALIAVVVLLIQDKSLNTNLTRERDRLQTSYSEMKTLVDNLTRERDRLQTSNSEMKSLVDNLTQETNQLQTEVSELREQLETASCPDKWIRFGNSCYSYYTVKKTMSESQQFCETHGAQLPIVSSEEEQIFLSSFPDSIWIGLTDEETEGLWKWVDGTKATTVYWADGEPNNGGINQNENCVHITKWIADIKNWNDLPCNSKLDFICEKTLK
ncbi:CD209 antigen-like protein D [Trachinotus anak]|uniref:CD209 antigen-like protein D n=1 Tax=Trachinotus anak TaxID=443729 RepID=UPI0039F19173